METDRCQELEKQVARQQLAIAQLELAITEYQQQQGGQREAVRPVLYRVVLTGGPCGGKTTALAEIKARLESLGFLLMCVPEAATLLFGGGCPPPSDEASAFVFQRNLIGTQIALEEAFIDLAKQSGRPTVILLDRGAMDGKAYMSEGQWELMLDELRLTPTALRDQRYDAILHLVTAADGAEPFYTLANNAVRTETPEEARLMDQKTLDCWTGHEHLYIVDNSTSFEEKMRRAVTRIARLVGVPAPLAITRKFLLERRPTAADFKEHVKKFEEFEVDQTYLATNGANERCRIRRRQQGANVSFQHQLWITDAAEGGSAETRLMERTLTAREYNIMLKQADPARCTVSKTLICFTWANCYWELNSFKGDNHVAILEVEAESIDTPPVFPDFVQVVREVTSELSYDSYLVAEELANSVKLAEISIDATRPKQRSEDVVERKITEVLSTLERKESCHNLRNDDASSPDVAKKLWSPTGVGARARQSPAVSDRRSGNGAAKGNAKR